MPRYVFGPELGIVELAPAVVAADAAAASAAATRSDVAVIFGGYTPDGKFEFSVPAYDPATHNVLDAIHVGLYAPTATVPTDPAEVLLAPLHYASQTGGFSIGVKATVDAGAAPKGEYVALAVLEFAS